MQHRATFFGYQLMNYADLAAGALKLVPSSAQESVWRDDYARMKAIFFTAPPSFDEVLASLWEIECGLAALE